MSVKTVVDYAKELEAEVELLKKDLERIAEARGRYSRDELTFARNTIEDMVAIANKALTG